MRDPMPISKRNYTAVASVDLPTPRARLNADPHRFVRRESYQPSAACARKFSIRTHAFFVAVC